MLLHTTILSMILIIQTTILTVIGYQSKYKNTKMERIEKQNFLMLQ